MSDFQLALVLVGALILLSVFVYNKLQERRLSARNRSAAEGSEVPSAPAGAAGLIDGASPPVPYGAGVEHHLGRPGEAEAPAEAAAGQVLTDAGAPATAPSSEGILDRRLDYIARLDFAGSHLGEEVLRRSSEILRVSRPVEWEGYSESAQAWEALGPSHGYRQVRAGLQLVNRRGVVSEAELLAFCQGLQALAVTLVGELDFPPRSEALKNGAELDRILADLDIQVALNVVKNAGAPMPVAALAQMAGAMGAVLWADGRFRLLNDAGAEIWSMYNLEPAAFAEGNLEGAVTRGVTVALDVPRAPDAAEVFHQFLDFARTLARNLEADLVDDNRHPVSSDALAAILTEVQRVRSRLLDLGIPAGSALAIRVFS